jgi:hypothetical protein
MTRNTRKRINFSGFSENSYLATFRVQKGVVDRICATIGKDLEPFWVNDINLSGRQKILLTLNLLGK